MTGAGTPPLVRFVGVGKTFDGRTWAVRDLDLDIRAGEFLTLLGPSGSGKTTTLAMLAGFEAPSTGEIELDGRPITRTPPHRRDFGVVFQQYALFPHLDVGANVAYPLTVRGVARDETARRVAEALAMVKLDGLADRRVQQLSGGQQQRVALARALVFSPRLVLMDEPLGALDKRLREHMQVELKALHRQLGLTFVYVTHDQSEALTMSDRVAVFDGGRVQQLDTVDRLYEAPATRFVAGFVGDSTQLAGTIAAREPHDAADDARVQVVPGVAPLAARNVDRLAPGAAAVACIRPERIEAHFAPPPADVTNVVPARVADVVYFGDHLRLRCALDGVATTATDGDATVKLPLGHRVPAHTGAPVWLRLPPEHLRVYA
jgi:putative spermidine/putrescine transport system ATP-binding protein